MPDLSYVEKVSHGAAAVASDPTHQHTNPATGGTGDRGAPPAFGSNW